MNAVPVQRIAVISTVHDTWDTRIYYKQIASLRRHYQVLYFTPYRGSPQQDWIVPLYKSRGKLGRLRTHLSLMRRLWGVKADLYLLHDPELLPLGIVLALSGRRVVWDMHEDTANDILTKDYLSPISKRLLAGIYRFFQSWAFRALDGFILAEDSYQVYFPSSEKTCVVHNYPLLDRLRELEPPARKAGSLVYIGSISEQRGVIQLIEAVARLARDIPEIHLTLIGPFVSEELEHRVRTLIAERGIEANVHLRGPMKNVEAYPVIAGSCLGLALLKPEPNFVRSLPTKMFEYMALGLPVVVSSFPLWKEIVERHRAGVAVDPLDLDAVCSAIRELLTNQSLYETLSDNARRAVASYSWGNEARRLIDFLSGAMHVRPPR